MAEKDTEWVEMFLLKLDLAKNNILEVEINGQKIAAVLANELKDFFKENKDLLIRLGKDNFKSFLMYIYQKKEEEAFMVLLQSMSIEQLLATLKNETASLKKYNDDMDLFMQKLKHFAMTVLLPITAKVLLALLLG